VTFRLGVLAAEPRWGSESSGRKGYTLAAVAGDELANGRHQLGGNLHDRLGLVFKGSFILCHRLGLGLLFIVSKNRQDSLFVPSWGKVVLLHGGGNLGAQTAGNDTHGRPSIWLK